MANRSDPDIHHRRSIRLKGYDYSRAGAYFITICTHGRECLLGDLSDGVMRLNEYGNIVRDEWLKTGKIRHNVVMDEFVIMPNHIHGIIIITDHRRGDRPVAPTPEPIPASGPKPKSIGSFIAGFKSTVTKQVNELRGAPGAKLWQRNYYEHVIRDEGDLNRIRQYILDNPARWAEDENNPDRLGRLVDVEIKHAGPWSLQGGVVG